MNANSFSSSSGSLQGLANAERSKPLFKNLSQTDLLQQGNNLKASLGIDINLQKLSGKQVFVKSVEFSLGVKFESSAEFKIPSPADVSKTILGFVENRLNAEKASGANVERLDNLLQQAKSGIEKGYAQAQQDIKDLGLMTDELAGNIAQGYEQVQSGLQGLQQKFVPSQAEELVLAPLVLEQPSEPAGAKNKGANEEQSSALNLGSVSAGMFKNSLPPKPLDGSSSVMRVNDLSASSADFVLKTQEGDEVLIRFAEIQRFSAMKDDEGVAVNLKQQSQFQFSVKGDLNEQELLAINDVLEQVGTISNLFFDDRFDQAFEAALKLGFDGGQIASLSLDLAKAQVQEVKVYEGVSKGALEAYKRNQPLINMAQQFERLADMLSPSGRFEELNSMVEKLVSKAIERYTLVPNDVQNEAASEASSENKLAQYQTYAQALLSMTTK